jgi:hypothetical protein
MIDMMSEGFRSGNDLAFKPPFGPAGSDAAEQPWVIARTSL